MKIGRIAFFYFFAWVLPITFCHAILNLNLAEILKPNKEQFRIGFLPVTCHLTCPVTHFINQEMKRPEFFEPTRFNGFPELKETFLSGNTEATFILAPMAMRLREEGVALKIVYLGHRDGTALMVHKESNIHSIRDLRGKTIAVPNRFSNQRLLIYRALKQNGMSISDVNLVEMPPPDMPVALATKAVDAVTSGEPFMAQTELDGYGRILYLTKDVWPNFISCVLAVHEDQIQNNRPKVQALVDGIAKSGQWLESGMERRLQASEFVAKNYYNQDPRLLRFVLSKPPDRVKYTNLALHREDFEEIEALGVESGILNGSLDFDDYADTSFVQEKPTAYSWDWKP